MLDAFHFLRPWWLLALVPAALLALGAWRKQVSPALAVSTGTRSRPLKP